MLRLSESEFKKIKNSVRGSGSRSVHKSDLKPSEIQAYEQAIQTICHVQSTCGDLFLRRSRFKLWTKFICNGKARRSDGSNIYKGVEDALNKVAYFDDKQNITFDEECPFSAGDN